MPRFAAAAVLLASLATASAWGAKQLIIDVEAENRPRVRNTGGKAPAAPPPAVAPELLLGMSENETARNLAQGVVDQLTALGYVMAPEVEYGRPIVKKQPKTPPKPDPKAPPKPPDPKIVLRIELVRMSGSCFVTAKAAEFKTQDISFFKYDTKDDTLPCTDQLKLCVTEFVKARPPDKPAPGPDAGAAPAIEAAALAEQHPKLVLAPTLLKTDEPAPLAPETETPDAAAAPAPAPEPEPAKKKGCGCASGGEGALLAVAATLLAPLARRRHRLEA